MHGTTIKKKDFEAIYNDSTLSTTKIICQSVYSKLCIKHRKYNEGTQEE
jgi:hypothetical protein